MRGFHDRVRDGNGWDTSTMTTRNRREWNALASSFPSQNLGCMVGWSGEARLSCPCGSVGRGLSIPIPSRIDGLCEVCLFAWDTEGSTSNKSPLWYSFLGIGTYAPYLRPGYRVHTLVTTYCPHAALLTDFHLWKPGRKDTMRVGCKSFAKALGHLVRVSSTCHHASTSRLSTRSSTGDLTC